MTCFAVVWTTLVCDDKCSILSSYVPNAICNLIPGQLQHIFSSIMTLNNWKKGCRNAMLHFQMTFLLPSTSYLLKLPNIRMDNHPGALCCYARGSQVGVVFYIYVSLLCGRMWVESQTISTWFEGFSPGNPVFLPLHNSTPSQKRLVGVLCSRIMHDRLKAAMHEADPVWAAPFPSQPPGLPVRVTRRHCL